MGWGATPAGRIACAIPAETGANRASWRGCSLVPAVLPLEEQEAREAFPEAVEPEPAAESVQETEAANVEESAPASVESYSEEFELVEETQEYEPEHASASHRVDAAAPRSEERRVGK